jgi:hypothetical protein
MTKFNREVHFLLGQLSGPVPGSFCLKPAISPRMREQIGRLEQNQEYSQARRAILGRVTQPAWRVALDGGPAEPDPSLLTTLACAVVFSDRLSRKESLDAMAVEETGKTWKALREFPDRIEGIARAMEKVNAGDLFAPEKQINAEATDAERFRRCFRDLPNMLRLWAKALKERMKHIRRLDSAVFGDSNPRAYLQFLIKESTGKPNDQLVANLLNAAAGALGKSYGLDATSLAKARFRRRKSSSDRM